MILRSPGSSSQLSFRSFFFFAPQRTKRGFLSNGFISSTKSQGISVLWSSPSRAQWIWERNVWTPPALDKGSIKRCMTLINYYRKHLHFTVFNTSQCQTYAGILHEPTDVIFVRPMFLSIHSLQLRVCPQKHPLRLSHKGTWSSKHRF